MKDFEIPEGSGLVELDEMIQILVDERERILSEDYVLYRGIEVDGTVKFLIRDDEQDAQIQCLRWFTEFVNTLNDDNANIETIGIEFTREYIDVLIGERVILLLKPARESAREYVHLLL